MKKAFFLLLFVTLFSSYSMHSTNDYIIFNATPETVHIKISVHDKSNKQSSIKDHSINPNHSLQISTRAPHKITQLEIAKSSLTTLESDYPRYAIAKQNGQYICSQLTDNEFEAATILLNIQNTDNNNPF